ncbi:MAG: SAM-dependent methyltransferase [Ruminococcaceae bacterium]|nr:SAM-dependent methyltransferase [Oscillospiraceae bacterium]
MKLSERLLKITEFVRGATVVADIGTDHGYVPVYCVQNGLCDRAIACDINEGPLAAARDHIADSGLSDVIDARLSDGLEALAPNEADTIVIAGMGGFLIRDILIRGTEVIGSDTRLILQPMVAAKELREYLADNGFEIVTEKLAREEDKFYNIMYVQKGASSLTEKELLLGKGIEDDENFGDYVTFNVNVVSKIINGLKKSKDKDGEIARYEHLLEIIKV